MKIVVHRGKCIAAANCIGMAPKVFMLDGMRKAIVIDAGGADRDTIVEAAQVCPTEAIELIDEETGKRVFPEEP